jgi:quercetin dioxygenase-like cupin family protein
MPQTVVHPHEGEALTFLGNLYTIKISAAATDNQYFIFEEVVAPTAGPPLHRHPEVEAFYIIEGEFEFILDDVHTPIRATAGTVIHVPSQVIHTFKNIGSTAGRLLIFVIPGEAEAFFREAGQPVLDLSQLPDLNQPPDLSSVDMNEVRALAAKHKIEIVTANQ